MKNNEKPETLKWEETMSKRKQESLFWGLVLLIVGVLFMLDNFGVDIDVWDLIGDFWPTILIVIGIKIILEHLHYRKNQDHSNQEQKYQD